jgi:hypothetical protein
MALKPICVKCQRFYRPEKNGFMFVEGMPAEDRAKPGTTEPEKWKPYKLWRGDLWKCHGCDHLIVSGVGWDPVDEHFKPSFKGNVQLASPQDGSPILQVNDC